MQMFSGELLPKTFFFGFFAFGCKKRENKVLYKVDYKEYFYRLTENKFSMDFRSLLCQKKAIRR